MIVQFLDFMSINSSSSSTFQPNCSKGDPNFLLNLVFNETQFSPCFFFNLIYLFSFLVFIDDKCKQHPERIQVASRRLACCRPDIGKVTEPTFEILGFVNSR